MRMYQKLPAFLDNPRMFSGYPELAVGVARDLFTIDGSAPELMRKKILRHGKKVGFHQSNQGWHERSDRFGDFSRQCGRQTGRQ